VRGDVRFEVREDEKGVAEAAGEVVRKLVEGKPDAVIAIPTGNTPVPLYKLLSSWVREKSIDLSRVRWFALDEFMSPDLPYGSSFRSVLEQQFAKPCQIARGNLKSLDPTTLEPEAEALRYESAISAAGGLDLAILGIGLNGHIAFNEPGTPFDSRTGLRKLSRATREANDHMFLPWVDPPVMGLSMGIGTLLEARQVLLMATGASKAAIVKRLKETDPTPDLPASALKGHADVTVVLDLKAAQREE